MPSPAICRRIAGVWRRRSWLRVALRALSKAERREQRAAPRHPGTPAPLNILRSTFPAACLWRGRTLLVLFAVLLAGLLSGENALAQGSVAGDRAALVALYNATDGANWANNTNWLSNNPLANWYGVTTNAGRVTTLALDRNNLTGSIPTQLGDLSSLEILRLYQNRLTGSIPPELGNLSNLRHLFLLGIIYKSHPLIV